MAGDDVTIGEVVRTLDRMEKKLDAALADQAVENRDVSKRIATLEQWRWFIVGGAGLGGFGGLLSLFGGG